MGASIHGLPQFDSPPGTSHCSKKTFSGTKRPLFRARPMTLSHCTYYLPTALAGCRKGQIFPANTIILMPHGGIDCHVCIKNREAGQRGGDPGRALDAGGGLLRLTPTWVPRSFLHPGKRIKLAPTDWYALGTHRGGIDERWFASTTEAANDGRAPDEGLSYCVFEGERFLLKDAVAEAGPRVVGKAIWEKYKRWPVYSKFFDNMGPIPHHMHQQAQARRADRPAGQARVLLLPAATERRREPLRLHVHGPGAGHHQGRRPPLPGKLGQGRQRHPRPVEGLSPEARHRLDDPRRRAARPGLDVHLRAAVGLRRVRHVPVAGRGPRSALGPAGQGRAEGQAPRPRLHRRAARLGEERRPALQGTQLRRADRRPGSAPGRATPTAGSTTAASTASSWSRPRS